VITTPPVPNRPPQVVGSPLGNAVADFTYAFTPDVTDPDGDALNYTLITAPAGMSVDSAGNLTWTPTYAQLGANTVTLRIDDSALFVDLGWVITVDATVPPLSLSLSVSPEVVDVDEPATISLGASGGLGAVTTTLTVDGVEVPLVGGQAQVSSAVFGRHPIVATVSDSAQTETRESYYSVRDPSDSEPPVVQLLVPGSEAVVTAPVEVIGTVNDPNLVAYTLALREKGAGTEQVLASGTTEITAATVGNLDPSLLINGLYDLVLTAEDISGQVSVASATVVIDGDLKVGNFSFTVEDLNVPVSGIPIREIGVRVRF